MKQFGLIITYLALLGLLIGFQSCNKSEMAVELDMDRTAFEREYAAWKAQDIKNYRYLYSYRVLSAMLIIDNALITAKENEPSEIKFPSRSHPDEYYAIQEIEPSDIKFPFYCTPDEYYFESIQYRLFQNITEVYEFIGLLFDEAEEIKRTNANRRKESMVKSVTLDIKWNEQYHYPEAVKYYITYFEILDGNGIVEMSIKSFNPE